MVKEQLVTRTLVTTTATVLYVELSTGKTSKRTIDVVGQYDNDDELLEKVKEAYQPEGFKAVHVTGKKEEKHLYGMTEDCFVKHARILPLRKSYYNSKSNNTTKKEENND